MVSTPRQSLPQVPKATPPPFLLPGEHFLAALCWLGIAAALVPRVAVTLARGGLFEPAVFATLHVLVLGVVTSAIFGALSQFVPGGLEVPLRSVRVGHAGFWLLQAGVAGLVAGFWGWNGGWQAVGWILIFGAIGAASINFLPARRKSTHGKLVGLYLSTAHSALGVALLLAAARIGATLGWWQVDRLGLLAAHLNLGAIGFATLTAIGVGSRMLPTFLLSRADDGPRLRWLLALTAVGLGLVTVGAVAGSRPVAVGGGGLLLAGGGLMLRLAWSWFAGRNRALDPALWQVTGAFAGLAASMAWGAAAAFAAPGSRIWAAYAASLVLGWLVPMVAGVMAKVLAHLSYIHLFRVMPGFARIGNPNRLLRPELALVAAAGLSLGGLGLPLAIAAGAGGAAAVLGWVWTAGAGLTLANYARAAIIGRWGGGGSATASAPRR